MHIDIVHFAFTFQWNPPYKAKQIPHLTPYGGTEAQFMCYLGDITTKSRVAPLKMIKFIMPQGSLLSLLQETRTALPLETTDIAIAQNNPEVLWVQLSTLQQ